MLSQHEIIQPNWYKTPIEVSDMGRIPYSHEGRFSLRVAGWHVPIVNIRYEPFNSIREKLEDDKVWVRIWTKVVSDVAPIAAHYWGCVCDGRIPKDTHAKSLCWIGSMYPPIEIAQEICKFTELEHEAEQFTFPESYWERRGGRYEKGWVTLPG